MRTVKRSSLKVIIICFILHNLQTIDGIKNLHLFCIQKSTLFYIDQRHRKEEFGTFSWFLLFFFFFTHIVKIDGIFKCIVPCHNTVFKKLKYAQVNVFFFCLVKSCL